MNINHFISISRIIGYKLYTHRTTISFALLYFVLIWPVIGLEYLPLVDLPNHLAVVRVFHDVLHGEFLNSFSVNFSVQYKPSYIILYLLFIILPKSLVATVFISLMLLLYFSSALYCLKTLNPKNNHPVTCQLVACSIAMLLYNASFFWGLLSYILAIPLSCIAFFSFLKFLNDGSKRSLYFFFGFSILSHIVHPIPSFFLGICLACSVFSYVWSGPRHYIKSAFMVLCLWPAAILVVQFLSLNEGTGINWKQLGDHALNPFHSIPQALNYLVQLVQTSSSYPTYDDYITQYPYLISQFCVFATTLVCTWVFALKSKLTSASIDRASLKKDLCVVGLIFIVSAVLRHDIIQINGAGFLWYPIRAPAIFSIILFLVLGSTLLGQLAHERVSRNLAPMFGAALLIVVLERSYTLRRHTEIFNILVQNYISDSEYKPKLNGYVTYSQDHLSTYHCYYDEKCANVSNLFMMMHPNSTLYPISPIQEKK